MPPHEICWLLSMHPTAHIMSLPLKPQHFLLICWYSCSSMNNSRRRTVWNSVLKWNTFLYREFKTRLDMLYCFCDSWLWQKKVLFLMNHREVSLSCRSRCVETSLIGLLTHELDNLNSGIYFSYCSNIMNLRSTVSRFNFSFMWGVCPWLAGTCLL